MDTHTSMLPANRKKNIKMMNFIHQRKNSTKKETKSSDTGEEEEEIF